MHIYKSPRLYSTNLCMYNRRDAHISKKKKTSIDLSINNPEKFAFDFASTYKKFSSKRTKKKKKETAPLNSDPLSPKRVTIYYYTNTAMQKEEHKYSIKIQVQTRPRRRLLHAYIAASVYGKLGESHDTHVRSSPLQLDNSGRATHMGAAHYTLWYATYARPATSDAIYTLARARK